MAAPQCMSQDGSQAVFVGTMLETGDGFALCENCLPMWAASLLQAMTGVDPEPFIRALSEPDGEIEQAAEVPAELLAPTVPVEPDPPSPNGKRGRTSAKSPAAGTATAPNAEAEPTQTAPQADAA